MTVQAERDAAKAEGVKDEHLPPLPDFDDEVGDAALSIWNALDGSIDWSALPFLAALHRVDDMEHLAYWLVKIRAGTRATAKAAEPPEGSDVG